MAPPASAILARANSLGDGEQIIERQPGAPGDPAGQGCGGALGGVRGDAGEIEQFADLLRGRTLYACLAGELGDPLVPGHPAQLSRASARVA